MSKYSVGIDLGTTHSCVGVYKKDGIVDIISNEHSQKTTPSYVSFTEEERHVGKTAKDLVGRNPRNTVYDAKRLIGKHFSDPSIQKELKYFSFGLEPDDNDKPIITVEYLGEDHRFQPEEISAMVLEKMKKIVEHHTKDTITDVVITVPAYFNDSQRQATKDAGEIAGLNVLRIINEPTAAAIAYGLDKHDSRNVLIYDLGGGTLDVTILFMQDGILTVKSTCGDTHLGGEDFDNKLREFCLLKFADKNILKTKLNESERANLMETLGVKQLCEMFDMEISQLDDKKSSIAKVNKYIQNLKVVLELQNNAKLMRRLKTACEEAKKSLSESQSISVTYDNFYDGIDLDVVVSRPKFEALCGPEFERCLVPVDQALRDSNFTANQIDDVVLVGGSTRIPRVQELLNQKFPDKVRADINPDEAVAYGAAVQAAIINKDFDSVTGNIILVDVTPLTLGIEIMGGVMEPMIKRNSSLPAEIKRTFSTSQDNQPMVTIKVFEGERSMTKDNNLLGKFNLKNIPPKTKGEPKIDVTFNVDVNGIMTISAEDQDSGNVNDIIIKNEKNRLSTEEIANMISNAEQFAQKDKEVAERINAKLDLETYLSRLRKDVGDVQFQEIMGKELCAELTEEFDAVTNWVEDEDNEELSKENITEKYKLLEDRCLPLIEQFCILRSEINRNKKDIKKSCNVTEEYQAEEEQLKKDQAMKDQSTERQATA